MKIAVIQARMGSSRLPGKVLMELAGQPVLQRVYERARVIEGLDGVVVATSDLAVDDALAGYCDDRGIPVFRGDEGDVLGRYRRAAEAHGAQAVMRITADCPFLDPRRSTQVLQAFEEGDVDYACNIEPPFLPDGLDTEVISTQTLARLDSEVAEPELREHVTLFVRRNLGHFRTRCLHGSPDWSHHRVTLDTSQDLERLQRLAEILEKRDLYGYVEEVVQILEDPAHGF